MGDPKRIRKKYSGPRHPWQKSRLDEEKILMKDYSLKNKQELWKMISVLKKFTSQAKKLIVSITEQAEKEKKQLINRLARLGLFSTSAKVEDVLELQIKDIMERRLQTLVYRKGYAKTMKQARQFITHEHIMVEDKKITSPSNIITLKEESQIEFTNKSKLSNPEHAERAIVKENPMEKKEDKEDKENKKETKYKKQNRKTGKTDKRKEQKKENKSKDNKKQGAGTKK